MKTKILSQLHQRAIDTLAFIDKAEERRNYWMELAVRHQMTNFKNELKLWPMGRPSRNGEWGEENVEYQVNLYNQKILPRLEKRYLALLDRITACAITNVTT